MTSSQVKLDILKVEYCEFSEPLDNIFRCKLTQFGFVFRCLKSDKKSCPDLEFFRKQKKRRQKR